MIQIQPPSFEEFLAAPLEAVAEVAPQTVFVTPGGTRRSAVLAGLRADSEAYAVWARRQTIEFIGLLFRLGVRHVCITSLRHSTLSEIGHYRERLIAWAEKSFIGEEAQADYLRLDCKARLIGAEGIPELHALDGKLRTTTAGRGPRTIWYNISTTRESHWEAILETALRVQARTRTEVVRALYGEDIPLGTMCISNGKPIVAADIFPFILAGEVQCYWFQRPGFTVDEHVLRHVLYDYAYQRNTWAQDKSQRYTEVPQQRALWERKFILGLGRRVGPFWYPLKSPEE
jgi:hypothetical protein